MTINLNEKQKEAVTYDGDEPLIIEAGPGSGKTRVLTERVKFLLNEKKVDPETLLVITFTRKATEELKNRLFEDIDSEIINKMQISTIHGFCYDLLKKYGNFAYEILDDDYNQKKTLFIYKNRKYLGFENEFYIPNKNISDVIGKFSEYSTFNVDSSKLVDYISKNRPIADEYIRLVKDTLDGFPYKEVQNDDILKESWYNARYLQIARAYKKYLNLLDKNYLVDYDTLQIKTLEFLKENPETNYKNILIDEFQDTNPIQYYIFEILLKGADSFTVVGDVDQSIYGFRGASSDYLMDMADDYNGHMISLNKNYRSTENVVTLTEKFIRDRRAPESQKNMEYVRDFNSSNYYITNEDNDDEAAKIVDFIKTLKEEEKIEKYSDVAILFRSLKGQTPGNIINLFKDEGIPFDVKNYSNLLNNDDVMSFITILHYILPEPLRPYQLSRWETEWLNLRAFTGESFTPTLWDLSDETCNMLNDLQDTFEENALETIKEIYKRDVGKAARIKKFSAIFKNNSAFALNRTDEMLEEMFERVPRPEIDLEMIKKPEDREFFKRLNDLKVEVSKNIGIRLSTVLERIKNKSRERLDHEYITSKLDYARNLGSKNKELVEGGIIDRLDNLEKMANENVSSEEFLAKIDDVISFVDDTYKTKTVLEFFYDILELTDYFDSCDERSLNNFSVISESIYNFENVMYNDDVAGYFKFLRNNIENWEETPVSDDEGVQIMTIHKSKGLEFPVVIIPSIKVDKFPKKYEDPSKKNFIYPTYTYFTPNDCLKYNDRLQEEEEAYHDLEELRILYVAITRAQDTVLLSFLGDVHPLFEDLVSEGLLRTLDCSSIVPCQSVYSHNELDVLNTSYTSLKAYEDCPFRYKLLYDLNFKVSENDAIRMGSAIHNAFNKVNIAKIDNPDISQEECDLIIEDIFMSTSNISKDKDELEMFKDNIYAFYDEIGDVELLESEYNFNIFEEGFNVVGSIDLIYKKDGDIYIIDYKNTDDEDESKINYYEDQLKLYLYALAMDSKYENENINKAGIYFVKSQKTVTVQFEKEEIQNYIERMNTIVEKIKNGEFDERKKSQNCDRCDFRFICN